jgi:hypothetical protein
VFFPASPKHTNTYKNKHLKLYYMKKHSLLLALFSILLSNATMAQGFVQLGTQSVLDQGSQLIATSDGGYITAGFAGEKAVLYRTDCLGNLVAQIEVGSSTSPTGFSDVIELADGSIVAAGLSINADTILQVFLLKTNSMLVEMANSNFLIQGKSCQAKSLAQTPGGELLIFGEVIDFVATDFLDLFLQRVDPITLQPSADPILGTNGLDVASRILPTSDGNYLLTGSSYIGDIFDPAASVQNFLRAYKVDENGSLIWQAAVEQTTLALNGRAQTCGAVENPQTGNFMLGGNMYGGNDVFGQDIFYALIDSNGVVLDTSFASAPDNQRANCMAGNSAFLGAYSVLGDGDGSTLGIPSIVFSQAIEFNNAIFNSETFIDPTNLISIRGVAEVDPGRFAYMGTLPDNFSDFSLTDIIISTPVTEVDLVYQNCALAASLTVTATAFEWIYEGQTIPGANQSVYFPTKAGLYEVRILDDSGCFGTSDTFRVNGPRADFDINPTLLTAAFDNNSQGAITYAWDFGDGSTSTQSNPTHTYTNSGVYSVRLIATDNCGLKDTLV